MSAKYWRPSVMVWAAIWASSLGRALGAPPATEGPKCALCIPTKYTVTASEGKGGPAPVRTLWLWEKDKERAELKFWKDKQGIPIIKEDEFKVFHVDLFLSDFDAIYNVLRTEKHVEVIFQCARDGGYDAIHVSGGSDVPTLKRLEQRVVAHETEKNAGKPATPQKLDKDVENVLKQLAKERQQRQAAKQLQEKEPAIRPSRLFAKIYELHPCGVTVIGDPVNIEVSGEMAVGADQPRPRLFIVYMVLRNTKTGEFVLKKADSILISPGSGVCFLPEEPLYNLKPGAYELTARVNSANLDGSETVHDTKRCRFSKIDKVESRTRP